MVFVSIILAAYVLLGTHGIGMSSVFAAQPRFKSIVRAITWGRFSVTSACFCPYLKVNGGRYPAALPKTTGNEWIL